MALINIAQLSSESAHYDVGMARFLDMGAGCGAQTNATQRPLLRPVEHGRCLPMEEIIGMPPGEGVVTYKVVYQPRARLYPT